MLQSDTWNLPSAPLVGGKGEGIEASPFPRHHSALEARQSKGKEFHSRKEEKREDEESHTPSYVASSGRVGVPSSFFKLVKRLRLGWQKTAAGGSENGISFLSCTDNFHGGKERELSKFLLLTPPSFLSPLPTPPPRPIDLPPPLSLSPAVA